MQKQQADGMGLDPSSSKRIPKPEDGVMVFDGGCNLCSRSVRTVAAMDREGLIRFAATQSPTGRALCLRHGIDPDDPTTFLFMDHGRALRSSEAMLAIAARLPRPWRWLGVARIVPRPVRDAAYGWLARNRYRLFGRRNACTLPAPGLAARFVDRPES